jgi:outer membrane murein-binding lipoprotein Lpp
MCLLVGCKHKPQEKINDLQLKIDSLNKVQNKLQNEKDSISRPPYNNDSTKRAEYWQSSSF